MTTPLFITLTLKHGTRMRLMTRHLVGWWRQENAKYTSVVESTDDGEGSGAYDVCETPEEIDAMVLGK